MMVFWFTGNWNLGGLLLASDGGASCWFGSPRVAPIAWLSVCRQAWEGLGQSGESCEPRAPAKLMVKAGARCSFLAPLPQAPGASRPERQW